MNAIDVKDKTTVITGNRVLISVYAECPPKLPDRKTRLNRGVGPTQFQERDGVGRAAGSNRREQLLGYARELRNSNQDLPSHGLPRAKQVSELSL